MERGNEFVVYRPGPLRFASLEQRKVLTPDDVVGRALVLKATPRTAVALVTRARTEIHPGDRFRTP